MRLLQQTLCLLKFKRKNESPQIIKKSYAQIIHENQIDPDCVLKIRLTLTDNTARAELMERLKSDNICEDAKIYDITAVGTDFLTIKVTNDEDVAKIKKCFNNKIPYTHTNYANREFQASNKNL